MRRVICVLMWMAAGDLVFASEPGQPLDCSDWVMVKPGITCQTVLPYPCAYGAPGGDTWCGGSINSLVDNDGFLLGVVRVNISQVFCGSSQFYLERSEVRRFNGLNDELIAYLPERCGVGSTRDGGSAATKSFDEQSGYLYVTGDSYSDAYPRGTWLIRLEGFTTESEVLQTYTSSTGINFRVPVRPEEMPGVDSFSTYWGNLSEIGRWSKAHGLQCAYPASPPNVGDYETVADPLPTPPPGQGYYYVTATTYQGQTRYGRKTTAWRQSGRDPGLLPICSQE